MTDGTLDLGPVGPGATPLKRAIGASNIHPWAPSELAKWDRSVTTDQVIAAAGRITWSGQGDDVDTSIDWPADEGDAYAILVTALGHLGITVLE